MFCLLCQLTLHYRFQRIKSSEIYKLQGKTRKTRRLKQTMSLSIAECVCIRLCKDSTLYPDLKVKAGVKEQPCLTNGN